MNETQRENYEINEKEITNHSLSFEEKKKKSIAPKIGVYNIVITTYRNVGQKEAKYLIDFLQAKNISRQIWFLGAPTENEENPDISRVSIIGKSGIAYDAIINLNDWLDKTKPVAIFHDTLRLKHSPSSEE